MTSTRTLTVCGRGRQEELQVRKLIYPRGIGHKDQKTSGRGSKGDFNGDT